MLAYYVQWHMMEAWRPLLYADEDQQAKVSRDPAAPTQRSCAAMKRIQTKELPDGTRVHTLQGLLHHLSAIVRNTCRGPSTGTDGPTFTVDANLDAKQRQAFYLL